MDLRNVRLVVFDLDGTLFDTFEDIAWAVNRTMSDLGLPARTLEEVRSYVGEGIGRMIRLAVGEVDDSIIKDAQPRFLEYYRNHLAVDTRAYPGVEEFLDFLAKRECSCAVLSNKRQAATSALVEAMGWEKRFQSIWGERTGVPRKPEPDSLHEIMGELGFPADQTLMVGDTEVDIIAAQNAGVLSCGVTYGLRSRKQLHAHTPDRLVDDLRELIPEFDPPLDSRRES